MKKGAVLTFFVLVALLLGFAQSSGAQQWDIGAEFANSSAVYTVTVIPTSTTGLITGGGGRVTSWQTGCLVPANPCPTLSRTRINCGVPALSGDVCQAYFKGGTSITLIPKANSTSVFAGWMSWFSFYKSTTSGTTVSGVNAWSDLMGVFKLGNYRFLVSGDAQPITSGYIVPWDIQFLYPLPDKNTVYAFFENKGAGYVLYAFPDTYNTPGAKITSVPAGINCQVDEFGDPVDKDSCWAYFPAGSTVRLQAVPGLGKKFLWWLNYNPPFGFKFPTCDGLGSCVVPMIFFPYAPIFN